LVWRPLRCAFSAHEYHYEGVLLGNCIERCRRCDRVRLSPTAMPGTVHVLPLIPRARAPLPDAPSERRTDAPLRVTTKSRHRPGRSGSEALYKKLFGVAPTDCPIVVKAVRRLGDHAASEADGESLGA
jgi:hypothetical protein